MKIRKMFEGKEVVQYHVIWPSSVRLHSAVVQWLRICKDGSGSVQVSGDGYIWRDATNAERAGYLE